MLKLPKGLKKNKKKGKKSKKKGEAELFTEEELEKYKKEHQQRQAELGEGSVKENEEWSKFKDLTTGVDSVLKKTQGDLDRIKSTSFFQRVPAGPREVNSVGQERAAPREESPARAVVEVTVEDFPKLRAEEQQTSGESSGEEEPEDDIFDTSYVEAVERGEVKLAYVPESPPPDDDDIFDTSHVDELIRGPGAKARQLDIGVAVEVLTGRIHNVALPVAKRSKRTQPADLLLNAPEPASSEPAQLSLLDADEELPAAEPVDLSVSLHTYTKVDPSDATFLGSYEVTAVPAEDPEDDEFTLLAAESLESATEITKLEEKEIILKPVLEESWSAFEADKNTCVFAESIVEDQSDILNPYEDDPFDTTFVEAVVPKSAAAAPYTLEEDEDDDFDPRAEEVQVKLNNRRKSSVRIHLTDPSGIRESITSDDNDKEEKEPVRDLLGGSSTDLSQLVDAPLDPVDTINAVEEEIDPFDTSAVDLVTAPGKIELKLLEKELIDTQPPQLYRIPSDPDFDPRAEEPAAESKVSTRRPSRPENLSVSKSVVFDVSTVVTEAPTRPPNPVTPYYSREASIVEETPEAEVLRPKPVPPARPAPPRRDPFDTSFAGDGGPSRVELKLLAKEFSCEEELTGPEDLLDPEDNIFQVKALSPEPPRDDYDPFDTSFAASLQPGKTELKLLESEFLN